MTGSATNGPRRVAIAAALALAACVASLFPASLALSREGLAAGEWWRLYSAPLVHLDLAHGLLDVGALCFLILAFGLPRRTWLLALCGPVAIGLGTLLIHPEFASTCGLSGLLHGLFALIALEHLRAAHGLRRAVFAGALIAVVAKAGFEVSSGVPLLTGDVTMSAPIAFGAHLFGVLVGLACGIRRAPQLSIDAKSAGTRPALDL